MESGSTYEVVGDPSPGSIQTGARPFGAFTTLSTGIPPPPIHPPTFVAAAAQKGFRKTTILVTLSLSPTSSYSTKSTMSYTIVTQTQVLVNCNYSKPSAVTRMVSSNVGYDVILLDSKCYPLLDNSVTTSIDFWKLARKIMAASKSSYEEITGKKFKGADINNCTSRCASNINSTRREFSKAYREVDTILAKIEKMEHGYAQLLTIQFTIL